MPSSRPDGWQDRLFKDLSNHERDRESLGFPPDQASPSPRKPPGAEELPNLPRYEIRGRLGEGATAVVYRALDRELGREVALKVQRASVSLSDVARQRFRLEAQTAAGLSHPNVIMVHDAGDQNGLFYLVMELIDGRPLSAWLREGQRETKDLLHLLEKAARGVAAAHEKGIVHRDLKPSNILLTQAGEPKVADFGLVHRIDSTAELTRTGSSLGTPLYMSPEQVKGRGKEISPRTDVYSLGAILYEILTGRPPHLGETMLEIYENIIREDPIPPKTLNPKLSDDLQTVALKALEKDPERRYADAGEFAEDLRRYLAGEPVLARPASPAYRMYRRLKKSPVARGVGVAIGVGLLTVLAIVMSRRSEREEKLSLLRKNARTSLEAVLKLRRAGANEAMKDFVPGLEASYRQALESAPEVAEVEYLMGRMHRALMQDDQALAFQERALAKDPEYAPALYERAVLRANRHGSGLTRAVAEARRLPPGPVTAKSARSVPLPDPLNVESGQQDLLASRDSILKDCTTLEQLLARGAGGDPFRHVGEAHILTVKGILAFYRLEFAEARKLLEEAVKKDPSLEEAWSALCETAYRQANAFSRKSTDTDEILRLYREDEELYGKAIANDAGYVPHWIGRADSQRHRAFIHMARKGDPMKPLAEAEDGLTKALGRTRDFPNAWYMRASVRLLRAVCTMDRSENPSKDLEAAAEDITAGMALDPDDSYPWMLRGQLHNERARWMRQSAANPLADYKAAEEAFGKALELDPAQTSALTDRGQTRMFRGEWRRARAMDPLPDFAGAEADFTEAIRSAPNLQGPWEYRGQVRSVRGGYRERKGEEPLDDFAQAEEDFTEALRIHPANARSLAERASARTHLSRLREKRKEMQDAARIAADAVADFKKAFSLNASLESSYAAEVAESRQRLGALDPPK